MSKSKALSIEQTQTLRRRGRGVPKKSLDTGDRFIDGLKLANAFGVSFNFQTEPVRTRPRFVLFPTVCAIMPSLLRPAGHQAI